MKILVINLKRRADRLKFMSEQLAEHTYQVVQATDGNELSGHTLNFRANKNWVDPILERKLTCGEVATALSHYQCWELCAEGNENVLILEDDTEILNTLDLDYYDKLLENNDVLYLNYKEMFEESQQVLGPLTIPYYPYHTNAYAITPAFAKHLISLNYLQNIIPVDELFSILSGVDFQKYCLSDIKEIQNNFVELSNYFFKKKNKFVALTDPATRQIPREVLGSDIEVSPTYIPTLKLNTITFGTDEIKTEQCINSFNSKNIEIINLGKDVKWAGGDVASGPGGGQKINAVKTFLQASSLGSNEIILFVDGYDVVCLDNANTIIERFFSFDCDILFAAEKTCWPDTSLETQFTDTGTKYKFLNSGCFIGYKQALLDFFNEPLNDSDDDQLYCQKEFLKGKHKVLLDSENYVFQCISGAEDVIKIISETKQIVNLETNCCPCILHGNGGSKSKEVFTNLYRELINLKKRNNTINFITSPGECLEHDIYRFNFLEPESCKRIIELAESKGAWESMDGDKFPAQEIRVKEISEDLFNSISNHLKQAIYPEIENIWFPLQMYGVRDMFIIKYSPDTQSSLGCHHDASLVSGIIKLNDDYEGGETFFYRQSYYNRDVPVGDIVVWPGQVTHGHEGRPVTSGTKYNLVIWTSRFEGDVNF